MTPVHWSEVSDPPPLDPAAIHCWCISAPSPVAAPEPHDKARLRQIERTTAREWREHLAPRYMDRLDTRRHNLVQSTAHACGVVLLAFACDRRLGIDLESRGRRIDPALQRRVLRLAEVPGDALDDPCFQPDFLRVWTRLEAHAKATRRGIRFPLRRVPVPWPADAVSWREAGTDGSGTTWHMADIAPGDGFVAALLYDGPPASLHFYRPSPALSRP